MQASELLLETTAAEEGYRQFPYRDVNGNWTVGNGHLILPDEDFSAGLTKDQALSVLNIDMCRAEAIVNRELGPMITAGQVSQGEYDACCDAVFNMGDFLKGSTLLKDLAAGNNEAARQQLERWDYAGSKPNAGLHARRLVEMDLWARGAQG
jgi:lysozyme